MKFDRRSVLGVLGSAPALTLARPAGAQPTGNSASFAHGVASGDPAADGAVIWTRLTVAGDIRDVTVEWQVSETLEGPAVRSGTALARVAADHTVKVVVTGLKPGRDHHYRFQLADGTRSPTGRFRTLPVGPSDRLVIALASCQLYPGGFFNAYRDMSRLERLDAVVHLGDYIYEYGPKGYGAEIGARLNRLPDPPREILSLADYRRRHAQVKSDPDLQAAHARAAFICVWDDHESANDGWLGGAEEHDPATEGDWPARKAAAMQAYFEWMPIRDPVPGRPWEAINRSFEFGDLATLAMLETRLLARSRQVDSKISTPSPEEVPAMLAERAREDRELLGPVQQGWLEGVLAASTRAGKPWQLIGSQVVMARVGGLDVEKELGPTRYAEMLARLPANWRARLPRMMAAVRAGLPFNLDSWDGYPPARERLYRLFRRVRAHPIVLSGDSHAAWANNLRDERGRQIGAEFGTTAITSPSFGALLPGIGALIARGNPEVAFCDQDNKGYALLTLTPADVRADFVAVSSVMRRDFTRKVVASYRVAAGPPSALTPVPTA